MLLSLGLRDGEARTSPRAIHEVHVEEPVAILSDGRGAAGRRRAHRRQGPRDVRQPRVVVALPSERAPAHLKSPGNLDQDWVADTSRIRTELGYAEPVPRSEAIRRTIAWERAHPPAQYSPAGFDYPAEDAALATQ